MKKTITVCNNCGEIIHGKEGITIHKSLFLDADGGIIENFGNLSTNHNEDAHLCAYCLITSLVFCKDKLKVIIG